jgi:hypothetical protein
MCRYEVVAVGWRACVLVGEEYGGRGHRARAAVDRVAAFGRRVEGWE